MPRITSKWPKSLDILETNTLHNSIVTYQTFHTLRIANNLRQDFPEYYNVGHDDATPQVDVPLIFMSGPKETLSFLFGGIGDARHLYATLTSIAEAE